MPPNPAGPLSFIALLVLSIIAIFQAKGKWMLWNLLIILAHMVVGLALSLLFILLIKDATVVGVLAANIVCLFGAMGAIICMRRNKRRQEGIKPYL